MSYRKNFYLCPEFITRLNEDHGMNLDPTKIKARQLFPSVSERLAGAFTFSLWDENKPLDIGSQYTIRELMKSLEWEVGTDQFGTVSIAPMKKIANEDANFWYLRNPGQFGLNFAEIRLLEDEGRYWYVANIRPDKFKFNPSQGRSLATMKSKVADHIRKPWQVEKLIWVAKKEIEEKKDDNSINTEVEPDVSGNID